MAMARLARATFAAWLVSLAAACGTPPGGPAGASSMAQLPAQFQAEHYAQAASRGEPVYRVDTGATLVTLVVRRAGSLARLGHDHVVASRSVQGYVAANEGRADLYVPLAELIVDEPVLRTQAGLDTQPTASDIDGTRANMLDKVLEIQRFPQALVRGRGPVASPPGTRAAPAEVTLGLHGTSRTLKVPLDVDIGPEVLTARGALEIRQTDFGITPFSILGGAIQVKDEIEVQVRIRAVRMRPGDLASTP